MVCTKCGAQIADGSTFCPMCGAVLTDAGTQQADGAQQPVQQAQEGNTQAAAQQPVQQVQEGNTQAAAQQPVQQAQGVNPQQGMVQQPVQQAQGVNPQQAGGAQDPNPANKVSGFVKNLGTKKLVAIAVAAVVVLVVLIAVLAGGSSNKYLKIDKNSVRYLSYGYFMDAKGNVKEFDDVSGVYSSMDYSVTVYVDYDGDLYLVDNKLKAEKIASDVASVRVGTEGGFIVYLCNEDNDYYNETLYIYNVSKKKSNKIDKDVYGGNFAISASGETVAYIKDYENGSDFETYIAGYSMSPKKIASGDAYPVAVSDNGKKAYWLDWDKDLYYYNGKDKQKVVSGVSDMFWTNATLSEFIFNKDGKAYLCKPGKDEEKIGKSAIYSVLYPEYYGDKVLSSGSYSINYYITSALAVDSIKNQVVYCYDDNLYWVNKKATELVKIDSSVHSAQLSKDGSSVVYVSHEKVYRVDKFKENMDPKLLYDDEDISYLAVSPDLKKIYAFSYDDNAIYYIKNSKKAEKITEDASDMTYNDVDGKLYFISDEELYEAKTSSSSKKKVSVDGDAYYINDYDSYGIEVLTRDGSDIIYYLVDKKPVKLFEK